jgi:hypothetical protein
MVLQQAQRLNGKVSELTSACSLRVSGSPPPLTVYESGAESAQLHGGYGSACDFDAQSQMEDDESLDERFMSHLLGRMHAIQ